MVLRFVRSLLGAGRTSRDENAEANALGLMETGNLAAAIDIYSSLLSHEPRAKFLVNRGQCHMQLFNHAMAQADFQLACEREPSLAQAWAGLGDSAAAIGDHVRAVEHYDHALQLLPSLAEARNNRGLSLTALGKLNAAWRDLEIRFDLPNASALYPHKLSHPLWMGNSQHSVLVHWEQGFGDIIQYLRFLPMLAERTRKVVFECPAPLVGIARRIPGSHRVITAAPNPPSFDDLDCRAPLASLPFLLGIDEGKLSGRSYIASPPTIASQAPLHPPVWAINWRASATIPRRSASLSDMLALRETGLRLISVQKELLPGEDAMLAENGILEAGSTFRGFDDTADCLAGTQGLITVDTAVAHLAGAMGLRTILLLNEPADMRWELARNDSRWYSSVQILRKAPHQPWSALVEATAKIIEAAK